MSILQSGQVFAGHTIMRLLHAGDGAETYEVRVPEGRRALKVLEGTMPIDSKPAARLKQEAEAAAMVDHINVVRFYDAGLDQGRVWMLTEQVEGTNLRELRMAKGGRLPAEDAVRLIKQACEGIVAMHALAILHRSIRPENIIVTTNELVKVGGFQWVKMPGWGVKTTQDRCSGASAYSAPEYLKSNVATAQSDVYSMGSVLYELLAGRHPTGAQQANMMMAVELQLHHEVPPLHTLDLDIPMDLSLVVQQAMAREPAQRGTMSEFAARLGMMLNRLTVARRAAARSVPLPQNDRRLALTEPMSARPDDAPLQPSVQPASAAPSPWGSASMPTISSSGPMTSTYPDTDRDPLPPSSVEAWSASRMARDASPPPPPSHVPMTLKSLPYPYEADPASVVSAPSQAVRGGTLIMAAVPSAPGPESMSPTSAGPQQAPSGVSSVLPAASLQAASPMSRPAISAQHAPIPSGPVPSALPVPSLQPGIPASHAALSLPRDATPSEPSARGSTSIPVERSLPQPSSPARPARAFPVLAVGFAVLVFGVLGAWLLLAPTAGPAAQAGVPVTAAPAISAAPSAKATAQPRSTSAAISPSASAKSPPARPTASPRPHSVP